MEPDGSGAGSAIEAERERAGGRVGDIVERVGDADLRADHRVSERGHDASRDAAFLKFQVGEHAVPFGEVHGGAALDAASTVPEGRKKVGQVRRFLSFLRDSSPTPRETQR